MIKINFIVMGKIKESYYQKACDEYLKRLSRYADISVTEIMPEALPDNPSDLLIEAALKKESEKILKKIPKNSRIYALCIEGKEISSEEFGEEIKSAEQEGRPLCFIIGSSYGLHPLVKTAADKKLSLSKMTFPHRLFRVMMLEQLYRAFKISEGGNYHK